MPGFSVDGEPAPGVAAEPAAGAAVGEAEPFAVTLWSAPWTGGAGTTPVPEPAELAPVGAADPALGAADPAAGAADPAAEPAG
ncbi:MAG TPA: hypothetical protein VLT45_10680 [Kofleriaceae bacterium]|nr:hypothetical protein [Kofleriaceae bacterium]